MFDSAAEDEVDAEYRDFLRDFYTKPSSATQPPVATASEAEASEREEDDPDYNIFDDMEHDNEADPEEYQHTRATEVSCFQTMTLLLLLLLLMIRGLIL